MSYQIARIVPTRCPSRDGIIGASAQVLPMTYSSARLAAKLAGRMADHEYESGDDEVSFVAFETGGSPFTRVHRSYPEIAGNDFLPF
jgi:hypothetical protein